MTSRTQSGTRSGWIGYARIAPESLNTSRVESSPVFVQDHPFNLTVGGSLRPAFPDAECEKRESGWVL